MALLAGRYRRVCFEFSFCIHFYMLLSLPHNPSRRRTRNSQVRTGSKERASRRTGRATPRATRPASVPSNLRTRPGSGRAAGSHPFLWPPPIFFSTLYLRSHQTSHLFPRRVLVGYRTPVQASCPSPAPVSAIFFRCREVPGAPLGPPVPVGGQVHARGCLVGAVVALGAPVGALAALLAGARPGLARRIWS